MKTQPDDSKGDSPSLKGAFSEEDQVARLKQGTPENRAVVLFPRGAKPGWTPSMGCLGLGAERLEFRLIRICRPLAAHVFLFPFDSSAQFFHPLPEDVKVIEGALSNGPFTPENMAEKILGILPEEVERIAFVPADLPSMETPDLEALFAQSETEAPPKNLRTLSAPFSPTELPFVVTKNFLAGSTPPAPPPQEQFQKQGIPAAFKPLLSAEDYRELLVEKGLLDGTHPRVTLELSGRVLMKLGCVRVPLHACDPAQAVAALERIFPEAEKLLGGQNDIAQHFRFSINGGNVLSDLGHPLKAGDHLLLFNASVGG